MLLAISNPITNSLRLYCKSLKQTRVSKTYRSSDQLSSEQDDHGSVDQNDHSIRIKIRNKKIWRWMYWWMGRLKSTKCKLYLGDTLISRQKSVHARPQNPLFLRLDCLKLTVSFRMSLLRYEFWWFLFSRSWEYVFFALLIGRQIYVLTVLSVNQTDIQSV